jgi:hypothetical protein
MGDLASPTKIEEPDAQPPSKAIVKRVRALRKFIGRVFT